MSDQPSNAVFISYHRDVGGILAMALYQHLVDRQLDAFDDIESIRAGQFDTIILNQIAARPYFVLVLTPGTLDRCNDPHDWLPREIEQAIATSRVIVPVHTPNFDFDDFGRFMPEGLGEAVRRFNGQELPQRWSKYAVQALVEEFLLPSQFHGRRCPWETRRRWTTGWTRRKSRRRSLRSSCRRRSTPSGPSVARRMMSRERSPTTTKRSASTRVTPLRSTTVASRAARAVT